jgi:4-amino-4-deoxychorismate lyase
MILVNGKPREWIDITDRGFQYGDGLFETIEVCSGQAVFLEWHLRRLNEGCQCLAIPPPNFTLLRREIQTVCEHSALAGVLKIIITRGMGGRGYRQPDIIQPTRVLSLHPYPDYSPKFSSQGIVARFCTTRLGLNPALAGIKHLNRLEQILARAEWSDSSIQEGIMLDINDAVIEGTMSNLFYVQNNTLYTADLIYTGVAGVMREIIINLADAHKLNVIEHRFSKQDLLNATEVFICNSIIGVWPVKRIDNTPFAVGAITQCIQDWLSAFKDKVLDVD